MFAAIITTVVTPALTAVVAGSIAYQILVTARVARG